MKQDKSLVAGILTMHRVINYGSFMQAYSLKRVIEAYGYKVVFKDFRNGEPRHLGVKVHAPSFWSKVWRLPKAIFNFNDTIRSRVFSKNLKKCFENICWPLLNVRNDYDYDLSADVMVIGSDEVFNYTQNHVFGYVPCLFGHSINAPVIISYAASAGYASAQDVFNDGMKEEISSGLRQINCLSVRDENTKQFVEYCTKLEPTLVIDPTLIYDFSKELPSMPVVLGSYLLLYAYGGRMDTKEEINIVKSFAKKYQLRIISAGAYHSWCDENIVVGPFELLRVFKDALFVVTDTFHGSIFSMKFRKQFATFVRENHKLGSNSNKVTYLLGQFGLSSRMINQISMFEDVLLAPVPYDVFESKLELFCKTSYGFLEATFSLKSN